ncbi:MAG: cytochrome c biogenesis protein CcsA, partial [Planctomycetota bacterium]
KGSDRVKRDLYRVLYGATCFGILFSFIGTVLGGLWADDSWGRFWGWDPKENGALLIVIWNALMLHARWDGMVKGLGFAVMAIGGNIITAWSWFGTNELGIGLHSYGFTEGMLRNLAIFFASQMAFIIAGIATAWMISSARRTGLG